ncbi:ATP-binding protein [Marivirga arenosa]|uniref:histidine kinase n=1 Tax=Marivirga arenosa TaxID=3059076 RepID=A0AA51N635_9BACT|nr:ATP-binding protein [Marivirga sp. ABR2-2]WMN06879.1 ATP-binding protein [Marivirga sp. ABR2-2]
MNIWNNLKIKLAKSISAHQNEGVDLSNYRNLLFYYILLFLLILSPISIIPGFIYSIELPEIKNLIYVCVGLFIILVAIGFLRKLSINTRKLIFILSIFIVTWYTFFALKIEGPGIIYIFVLVIVSSLIHSARCAYYLLAADTIIILLIGLNLELNYISIDIGNIESSAAWLSLASNPIFLGVTIVVCIDLIFRKLEKIIQQLKNLNEQVKSDNQQLKTTQITLRDKNEELNKFAHTIAHDLKEPLRSMQSFAHLTISKYSDTLPDQAQEFLSHIKTSSVRMATLLDSLLEYAQIGSEKKTSSFHVKEIIEELKKDLNILIKENNAIIKHVDNLPEIIGYEIEFKQLMQNLISNAIKFKDINTKVEVNISVEEDAKNWKFKICDNGIGIDEKHQEKIFSIFHRLHKDKFPGTGLGLANCKKIVEMHNGNIWVESQLGKGSCFNFTISKDYT